ncbi:MULTISPECIES: hypothetical protein [unclassified Mucilaginibacter]|uniref:hypothetical protein n=1 Tax=unclassified Mucilaginibacter TaxID=2617802 RepID=UPI002AC98D40|nr:MULTISPECIES: hypothetical protein [unclassified Mucilaginibacter]MEB0263613.1 hypothetical protein [Mucilaginibacter sp. 10I4]MEB0278632.1 hypothetical protein [Mucilaginibacter sp. 10B2]MEB0299342.1 hypothetical protein [Mucilaginibacter sp. 5C4]WPX23414.1 hypothetical protein RHM67_19245 [Mucilaginibacter sp. 5C4]
MSNREHALRYLYAVEKKNKDYFTGNRLKITDCVAITGTGDDVQVEVIDTALPPSIQDDITAVFWI